MRILLVEDNELVANAAAEALNAAGFAIDHVESAERAHVAFAAESFDAAIVDIGLPGQDGLSLVRSMRDTGSTMPILILTARQTIDDKVTAFELGADDFLAKPYEQAELVARCRALIRRAALDNRSKIVMGTMTIDVSGRQLSIDGKNVDLTAKEWSIFECLLVNSGRIISKERLLQTIASWEKDVTQNAIEVYVSRLRIKLGDAAVVRTIRGLGYRLEEKK